MKEAIPAVIDSSWDALTPTYTQISYLKNDNTLLSSEEYDDFMEVLKEENYFGTPLPDIVAPKRGVANLKISIALTNKYKSISDVNEDVGNIIDNFYNRSLGVSFNTYELERKIEEMS